jgi:glycoside/pentoside/hexuronide:cation symporter, GPH family
MTAPPVGPLSPSPAAANGTGTHNAAHDSRMDGPQNGLRYGLMGLPLAFVALPLYVFLPNHYALEFGIPLATLGAILLIARLFDAFIDPLLGRATDRLFSRSTGAVLRFGAVACGVLGLGFWGLFFPPTRAPNELLVWVSLTLAVTYAAYSAVGVAHQAWGAMLGGNEAQRSRIVAWREGLGLAGVLLASIAPIALGLAGTVALFFVALALGWVAWTRAPRPQAQPTFQLISVWKPFYIAPFRRLLGVFMLNGIASAIPATLILFFVQDRLQAPASLQPVFLGSYFLCAALAIPLWLKLVKRIGLARTWGIGMLLAIAVFIFATQLRAGDSLGFIAVTALSGIALGTDLALPSALLAGVIADAGDRGRSEGAYFGWWNFATKLNLALAAGVALPLLGAFGYAPGVQTPEALSALTIAYCWLPCLLKLAAAAALYFGVIRPAAMTPLTA